MQQEQAEQTARSRDLPDQPDRLGAVGELVPLGRRVALDLPALREVVVLQGTRVLRVIPGRRARQEIRAQRDLLDQLEQEGTKVTRVQQGLPDLLAQGALRVLPDKQVRQVPQSPDQPDLQERTALLLGPPDRQVPQEPQALLPALPVPPDQAEPQAQ